MRNKIILAAVAGLLTAGCGSDTADPAPPATAAAASPAASSATPAATPGTSSATPTATTADELKVAVQAYSDAFLTGKAKAAYALLSERCRQRTSLAEFTGIVEAAGQLYGSALPMETYTASVSGDLARVTYTYSIKAINQDREPWAREDGAWRQDDC